MEITISVLYITALQEKMKPVAGPTPTSCNGVQSLGWTQNGYYTVKGSIGTKINTVYCEITRANGVTGLLILFLTS